MGRIHLIGTEHTAGSNDPNRKLSGLHGTDLYRRGLTAEQDSVINIERILLISCRMPLRYIQCFKIVIIVFHFRAFHYLIAHADEDPLYLIQSNRVGMLMSHMILLCGKSHINDLSL